MHTVLWGTGAFIWIGIALFSIWMALEMAWAFVVTVSYFRFQAAGAKAHKKSLRWKYFIPAFWRQWIDFLGYRKGSYRAHGLAGEWNGIGDWRVYPPTEQREDGV